MLRWHIHLCKYVPALLALVASACSSGVRPAAVPQNGGGAIIQTIGGNGRDGFSGDGGPALGAKIDVHNGLAVDVEGNVYISDGDRARVRKIARDGTITTFAGTGKQGFSGDGGPASSAQLYYPQALAVDRTGTLYIAESGSPGNSYIGMISRIRKVTSDGIITTFFGTTQGAFLDGRPDPSLPLEGYIHAMATDCDGNLYVGDYYRVQRIDAMGRAVTIAGFLADSAIEDSKPPLVDTRPATEVVFSTVSGIAVDCVGNIYVTAQSHTAVGTSQEIRRIDPDGTITRLVSGRFGFSGDGGPAIEAELSDPRWLALDAKGNLYISEHADDVIRMIERDTGIIWTVAGTEHTFGKPNFSGDGGPATQASLDTPAAIAIGLDDYLYIADAGNNRVRRVGPLSKVRGASARKK